MGADVIKVEAPEGDSFRRYGPQRSPGMGGSVLNLHRNKRSITLDLKDAGGRATLHKLIDSADVLVHNLRPRSARALGVDWPSLQARKPALVVCPARGFGQDGPYGEKVAYDDLI
jgi:crotonobetainyl-CoA:carnitine CoA-transferase CaiB-like acyl-CoA transferase